MRKTSPWCLFSLSMNKKKIQIAAFIFYMFAIMILAEYPFVLIPLLLTGIYLEYKGLWK